MAKIADFTIERTYTRDKIEPLKPGDTNLDHGWKCIPMPPPDDGEGDWDIFDTSKDYKTGWMRFRGINWAEATRQ